MRFRPADAAAVMVKQLGIMAARPQTLHQTACLPVGAVVDTFVEREDSDFQPACHPSTIVAWLFAFLTLIWITGRLVLKMGGRVAPKRGTSFGADRSQVGLRFRSREWSNERERTRCL
jgi:hypothetical protein